MRGMEVKEFGGTGYVAAHLEHNFRTLPFLALGIPFLYENNIEFILHGGAARAWGNNGLPLRPTDGWYTEAGFGLSRIFDIARFDFTWRLSAPKAFWFTFGIAQIL